jgi:hypothetical protein
MAVLQLGEGRHAVAEACGPASRRDVSHGAMATFHEEPRRANGHAMLLP